MVEAMGEGAFDILEGKGKPLDLTEDPFEDPADRMANRLLRNNGVAPLWIEESKEIETARETLAAGLAQAKSSLEAGGAREDYNARIDALRRQVASLNKRSPGVNRKAPGIRQHKGPIDPNMIR